MIFETYFSSSIQCQLVVTNCITGKAEYMEEKSDKERLLAIARASSSMPLASPMVYVDRVPYLDGGISDSIPIIHSLKTGHQKNSDRTDKKLRIPEEDQKPHQRTVPGGLPEISESGTGTDQPRQSL